MKKASAIFLAFFLLFPASAYAFEPLQPLLKRRDLGYGVYYYQKNPYIKDWSESQNSQLGLSLAWEMRELVKEKNCSPAAFEDRDEKGKRLGYIVVCKRR